MKHIAFAAIVTVGLFAFWSGPARAAIAPTSKLYFLQQWGESVKLLLTFSPQAKINYELELANRRISEMSQSVQNSKLITQLSRRYTDQMMDVTQLANRVADKGQVIEKIKEMSVQQQQILANVAERVSSEARDAIAQAQENSVQHVETVISNIQGAETAKQYVSQIQKMLLAPMPMENSPNTEPSQSEPKELHGLNQTLPLNTILEGQNGAANGQPPAGSMAPVAPMAPQAPGQQQ